MADGKKKRSLREAFGVVRPPEETGAAEPTSGEGGPPATGPVGAPEGGRKPAAGGEDKAEKKPAPRRRSRAGSSGDGSGAGARAGGRTASKDAGGDPVITGNGSGTRGGGRGRAQSGGKEEPKEEMVPGKGGRLVPAETPVNMTFTVTAKERYLWTLELKRRGLTAVGVLRETMEAMAGDEHGG